jgi:hypothetical protein
LSRKTLPKDAAALVASGPTKHRVDVSSALAAGNRPAADLPGQPKPESYWGASPLDGYSEQTGKAAQVTLAVVLAAMELSVGKHTWRNPSGTALRYFGQNRRVGPPARPNGAASWRRSPPRSGDRGRPEPPSGAGAEAGGIQLRATSTVS